MLCPECGEEVAEANGRCRHCGAELEPLAGDDIEIEVYDFEPAPAAATDFEKTLANAREAASRKTDRPAPDLANDRVIQDEIAAGYDIRRRRRSYRLGRPRNLVIVSVAAAVLTVAVVYGVRLAVNRLPKYNYAEPAHAAATARALAVAAGLEAKEVDMAAGASATCLLKVGGEGGKVFIDGNFVGETPARHIRVPTGRRHVVVKKGAEITLDEVLTFRRGERYSLEPAAAGALSGPSE